MTEEVKTYHSFPASFTRHGGCWDRGGCDCYYGRDPDPHYYEGATYSTERVTNLTDAEKEAYYHAYANGDFGEKWK